MPLGVIFHPPVFATALATVATSALSAFTASVAFVAFVTNVDPIAAAICDPVAAVNGEVPLPKATPLNVPTPVPPLGTLNTPPARVKVPSRTRFPPISRLPAM